MRKIAFVIAVAGALLARPRRGHPGAGPVQADHLAVLARQGTFTFTVHVTPFGASTPSTNGTYSITVGSAPPLTISFPSSCCNAGMVGSSYFQNFFSSGGIGPFTWTVAAGQLPPGVVLTGGHLGGTPTVAGTFTFTIKVSDSAGDQASEPGSITISP